MIVFVCGLSMSGKTSLIKSFVEEFPTFRHVRVSTLLRIAGRPTEALSSQEASLNQEVFLREVTKQLDVGGADTLIDGHLLIETNDKPYLVPIERLGRLPIDGVIAVLENSSALSKRREAARGEPILASEELWSLIALECLQAQKLAALRGVPFEEVISGDIRSFSLAIDRIRLSKSASE